MIAHQLLNTNFIFITDFLCQYIELGYMEPQEAIEMCEHYFQTTLSDLQQQKLFHIFSWGHSEVFENRDKAGERTVSKRTENMTDLLTK